MFIVTEQAVRLNTHTHIPYETYIQLVAYSSSNFSPFKWLDLLITSKTDKFSTWS